MSDKHHFLLRSAQEKRPTVCPGCRQPEVRYRDRFEREFFIATRPFAATGVCEACGWIGLYEATEPEELRMTNIRRDRPR